MLMERRTFLLSLPAVPLLAGGVSIPAGKFADGPHLDGKDTVRVVIENPDEPLVLRAFAILKDRIEMRCPAQVVRAESVGQIILKVSGDLPEEGFRIDGTGSGVRITGGSPQGLLFGSGKFLRTSRYDGAFHASPWRGTSMPQGSLRGMYFATHFHNWYHVAPEAEIVRYLEDLALWGVNALEICFPFINLQDWNDPQADVAVGMMRMYARVARDLGLQFGTGVNNTLFKGVPPHLRATPLPDPTHRRGNSGHPVCPSRPEGLEYIMENTRKLFQHMTDAGLDFLVHWPYDEGGCACEKCLPWGCNGFVKVSREITQLGREFFPGLKSILSTWMFDTPPEGEWQGLSDVLANDNNWVDYILADSHEEFPHYPLDIGTPGKLPLLNFPEISMWGNWPWGGVGANPLPDRYQRLWDQVKHVVQGGFPYSEGIYEDMNKVVVAQFYWDRDRSAQATLAEYVVYEFGPEVMQDCLALVEILEAAAGCSYTKQPVDPKKIRLAYEMAEGIKRRLPSWAGQSWRWELVYLRAVLDQERFVKGGLETPPAEEALSRLIEIYHCQMETDDPYHHRVRPPLRKAVTRGKEL